MPFYTKQVGSVSPSRTGSASRFSGVDLSRLIQGQGMAMNELYSDEVKKVNREAKTQVYMESAENLSGFLRERQNVNPKNVFDTAVQAEIRTENVLRGETLLKTFSALAVANLGNVDNMESSDIVTHEAADMQLEMFDKKWNDAISNSIADPEALSLLHKKYMVYRANLEARIARAKEKARNIRTRETAEIALNVAIENATLDDIENIGSAVVLASRANPGKMSDYYKQGMGAYSAIIKKDMMNNYVSEQFHKYDGEKPEQMIKKVAKETSERFMVLSKYASQNPYLFPPSFMKKIQESYNQSFADTLVDIDVIPTLQAQASAAVASGQGKDVITVMKAQAAQKVIGLGNIVEANTDGAMTRAEFERLAFPRINSSIEHIGALAALNDKNNDDKNKKLYEGYGNFATDFVKQVKEGGVFTKGVPTPLFMDAKQANDILMADKNGDVSVSDDFKELAEFSRDFPDPESRKLIHAVADNMKDENPDSNNFELAQMTVEAITKDQARMPDDKKRTMLRALQIRFEGMANEDSAFPVEAKFRRRFGLLEGTPNADGTVNPPPTWEKLTFTPAEKNPKVQDWEAILNTTRDTWSKWTGGQYKDRLGVARRNDRAGNITDDEKMNIHTRMRLLRDIDPDDAFGLQSDMRDVLSQNGEVAASLAALNPNVFSKGVSALRQDQVRTVHNTINDYVGMPSATKNVLKNILPHLVANDPLVNLNDEGKPLPLQAATRRGVTLATIAGTTTPAPYVNYQADFALYDPTGQFLSDEGYGFFDKRATGEFRFEIDPQYVITMLSQDGLIEADPVEGDAYELKNDNNYAVAALEQARLDPTLLSLHSVSDTGAYRYNILDPVDPQRAPLQNDKGATLFFTVLPTGNEVARRKEAGVFHSYLQELVD